MSSPRGTTSDQPFNPAMNILTQLRQPLLPPQNPSNLPSDTSESMGASAFTTMPSLDLNRSPTHLNGRPLDDRYIPLPSESKSPMPSLDLNRSPTHLNGRPLDDRYIPLAADAPDGAAQEEIPGTPTIHLTEDEKEHLAYHVFRTLSDDLKPLSGWEYAIVIPAILFALGACATSKDFGDKFVEGLESLFENFKLSADATKTGVAWGIAAANVCAQFSLSTNSVITVLTRLLRSRQRSNDAQTDQALADANETANKYDRPLTNKEKCFLVAVPFSAFATYKMGFDTLTAKYGQAPGIGHGVGALRYGSASLINFNFTYDQIYRWRGDEELPLINLLKSSKKRLINLADNASHPLAFIHALNENGLLKQLNGRNTNPVENNTHKKQLEALVDELFAKLPELEQAGAPNGPSASSRCTKGDMVQWISLILGGLVSLTNFKAGTKVPELFGLTVAKDLVEFFTHLAADWSLGIAALGFVFGVPSWFVNLIINARSCMNFANGIALLIKDINANGTDALKKYWSADGALVGLLMITSMGYGAGNGGSGYKYPPLNMVPIPIINLLLSSVVFTALGNLSQQGAAAKARDKKDDHLLQSALNAENLEEFYLDLSPADQKTLRRLLVNNVTLAFDSQISTYNKLQGDAVEGMLSEELQANLERRFGNDLTEVVVQVPADGNVPQPEPTLTTITIDPMLTREQRSALTSTRVDSMQPQTTTLPPSRVTNTPPNRPLQGANSSSPLQSGMMSSPHTLFARSDGSQALNIPTHPNRKHHHPQTHHSLLGTSGDDGLAGFGSRLMAPTTSPTTSATSPLSPHTPRLYAPSSRTPTSEQLARRNSETSAIHQSPTLRSGTPQ
jgi:hypothetical protein